MSLYPHLSQPRYRLCSIKAGVVCPTFPCVHFPCHDPDYLEDYEECLANIELNETAWDLYYLIYWKVQTSTLKDQLSAEEWALYEPKVERCRRIIGKSEQFNREEKAHQIQEDIRYNIELEQLLNDESRKDDPNIIALKKKRAGMLPYSAAMLRRREL